MRFKTIKTEKGRRAAYKRLGELWREPQGLKKTNEHDRWVSLIRIYERKFAIHQLDRMSFDQWVDFIFKHPLRRINIGEKRPESWFWKLEWRSQFRNARKQIAYCTKLFWNPRFLLDRFSFAQIDQNFEFMFWGNNELTLQGQYLQSLLSDVSVPLSGRRECIESMLGLYGGLFRNTNTDQCGSGYMWFDLVFDDLRFKKNPLGADERKIQNAVISMLERLLQSLDPFHIKCALHGLNHLPHPDSKRVIREFIKKSPWLDKDLMEYAGLCLKGRAQ